MSKVIKFFYYNELSDLNFSITLTFLFRVTVIKSQIKNILIGNMLVLGGLVKTLFYDKNHIFRLIIKRPLHWVKNEQIYGIKSLLPLWR